MGQEEPQKPGLQWLCHKEPWQPKPIRKLMWSIQREPPSLCLGVTSLRRSAWPLLRTSGVHCSLSNRGKALLGVRVTAAQSAQALTCAGRGTPSWRGHSRERQQAVYRKECGVQAKSFSIVLPSPRSRILWPSVRTWLQLPRGVKGLE